MKEPLRALSWLGLFLLTGGVVLVACARPGAPPGGPEDRVPPMVVSTWPDTFAVIEPTRDPVRIEYSERISEQAVRGTLKDAVLVSPETGEVRVEHQRMGLEISVGGGWKPGLVYRIRVLPIVRDLFSNAMADPFELVFSTGGEFQQNVMAGMVTDRITGEAVPEVRIAATELGAGEPPIYVTRTDSGGIYVLRYVPAGSYEISAFQDLNRNREPDFSELQAETLGEVGLDPSVVDTIVREVSLLRPDTTPARLIQAEVQDSVTLEVSFDDYLPTDFPLVQTRAVLTRDSVTEAGDTVTLGPEEGVPAVESLLWERELEALRARQDSIRAAEALAARRDSLLVTQDSLQAALARFSVAGDTVAFDSVSGILEAVQEELAPPEAEEEEEVEGRGRISDQELAELFLPKQGFFVLLAQPMEPGRAYTLSVQGVMNVNNLVGGGGETTVSWEPPEPPPESEPAALDTGGVVPDSGAVLPDTSGVPPDTGMAPPDTSGAPPDTSMAPPDTSGFHPALVRHFRRRQFRTP